MLAGTFGVLYLVLSLNALTCALHHGLYGACPHHGGGAGHDMAGMAGMSGMADMHAGHDGHEGSAPAEAPARGGVGLCHCLDNLAAEPPAALLAAAVPPPVAAFAAVPIALPAPPPAGPARPRAPPSVHPA